MTPHGFPRPRGFLFCTGFHGSDGRLYGEEDARRFGWLSGQGGDFRPPAEGVFLGENVFTDSGRQNLAYLLGLKSPAYDYAVAAFAVGTGVEPGRPTDEALQSAVAFADGTFSKVIDAVAFPHPFVAEFSYSLGLADANGYLLTEWGLLSGNGTLVARRTTVGLSKTSDYSPALKWVVNL